MNRDKNLKTTSGNLIFQPQNNIFNKVMHQQIQNMFVFTIKKTYYLRIALITNQQKTPPYPQLRKKEKKKSTNLIDNLIRYRNQFLRTFYKFKKLFFYFY